MGLFRRREQEIADRGGPVAESAPERAFPAVAGSGAADDPAARDGRKPGHPRPRCGKPPVPAGARARRALLGRRPPLRPGRRRGVRDGNRGRGGSHGAASRCGRTRAGGRAIPTYETPGRPGRRSFATTGHPGRDPMDLNVAAREALLEMIGYLESTLRPAASGGLRALQRRRRPADLRGRRRPLPARLGAPPARRAPRLRRPRHVEGKQARRSGV